MITLYVALYALAVALMAIGAWLPALALAAFASGLALRAEVRWIAGKTPGVPYPRPATRRVIIPDEG